MATGGPSTSPTGGRHHFVDIHPVLHDDASGGCGNLGKQQTSNPVKYRGGSGEGERNAVLHRPFSRQVSLETGVSVLSMQKEQKGGGGKKEGPSGLLRSGKSLGVIRDSRSSGDPTSRKGDFSIFRTKSTLNKQNSLLPSRRENDVDFQNMEGVSANRQEEDAINKSVPRGGTSQPSTGRSSTKFGYDSEDILLPKDEVWPFLLRFPIGCFGMCLGLSSQAILWGALSSNPVMSFMRVSPYINLVLWLLALSVLIAVSATYTLKCAFYFEAIRREYFHPVRVNFFFAPWIACMFLTIGLPHAFSPERLHPAVWCVFIAPVFVLELKIYGQWLSGGKRRLCKVANPSSHLSVIGNFVGAILAAKRLPTNEALPKELHPVYSMFIATPSAASIAWATIYGQFDAVARTFYFIALFLYVSLVVRINFFRGFKFSMAWWSYTFPMTTASLATIKYAEEVPCFFSKGLALSLSVMSSTMVSVLFVSTLLHALVWRSLFPNDLAIAITKSRSAGAGAKQQAKEKKPQRRTYDIKRWAKQSPLALVSSITKSGPAIRRIPRETNN
uniref:Guard cell S-type anion channel SLAC1 n=1 Tax=Ananas comosus var. bracteatus TaxID=296719 RepID=A0A6V7PK42_ANACO|nr:unnamed protein product [Ananas comosus var. bracteatus]